MIKKLKNKILFLIFMLLIGTPSAMAMTRGEIRYDITELSVYDSEITFEGWALIGGSQNGRDQYGNNTHQKIAIRGVDENGNYWPDAEGVTDFGGGNWNFYRQHYYFSNTMDSTTEVKNAYNGRFVSGWDNNCTPSPFGGTELQSQCFYENLGFSITLDVGDWDVDNTEMYFEIRAYNDDFGWTVWEELGIFEENAKRIVSNEYIKINTGTFSNMVKALVDDGRLRTFDGGLVSVQKGSYAIVAPLEVYRVVSNTYEQGGFDYFGRQSGYYKIAVDTTPLRCTLQDGRERTACFFPEGTSNSSSNNYDNNSSDDSGGSCVFSGNANCRVCPSTDDTKCPNIRDKNTDNVMIRVNERKGSWTNVTFEDTGDTCWVSNFNGSPRYSGDCGSGGGGSSSGSSGGGTAEYYVYSSWMKPQGELKITATGSKKCEVTRPNVNAACNSGGNSFSSDCEELTVKKKDGNGNTVVSGNVSVSETAFASVILSPTETFIGGGFKFGVLYYNKISWNILEKRKGSESDINNIMKDKLKDKETFRTGLKLQNVKLGNDSIQELVAKECKEEVTDNSVTTMCMLYLPNSELEDYSGKVTYNSGTNLGIKNKYYTPLSWNEKDTYKITANIVGMDRFKEDVAMEDSKDKTRAWTGVWETDIKNCSINLYPLLGIPKSSNYKYLFIYRPIDLNNPFPNRNAGMNWYDWYNNSQNKERLEASYSRLQYQITLDSKLVSEIKKYNKNELNNGGYLDWKTIDELGNSSFVDEYFNTKRQNIVE